MHDNKFGMFIHWGIYAVTEIQEQVLARENLDNKEYEKLMHRFNPVKYDPAEWVALAKNAGMKYICITTKHHDGFCMWDTKYTDYNIMNTPYGKDVIKMLAEECHKQGMLLSFYYSCPDWHHEHGFNACSTHQWKSVNKEEANQEIYREYVKNQITELMTNYGPIYTLFWDIPPRYEDKSMNELVRKLQPGIFINNRGWDKGDFSTPEREMDKVAGDQKFTSMVEMCESVGEQSWGYRAREDYQSVRYLTYSINKMMARGGSYLLNIGPKADGTISDEAKDILEKVGNWYNHMEGSLESPVTDEYDYKIKRYNCIVNKKDNKSYFNFIEGISSSAVNLGNFPHEPKKVRLMNTGADLRYSIEILHDYFDIATGACDGEYLHIYNIPTDELLDQPIVIEIEW